MIWWVIAKSFPRIPSSPSISDTMKAKSTVREPKTVSLTCPRQSRAHHSMRHSEPLYLPTSSSGRLQAFHTLVAIRDMPDPVLTRNLTVPPGSGRYIPFPTGCVYCDGGDSQFPERAAVLVGHSFLKCSFCSISAFPRLVDSRLATHCLLCSQSSFISPSSASSSSLISFR